MKQFNPKTVAIESGTRLASILQSSVIKQYSYYIGLDVHKDTIAISIASVMAVSLDIMAKSRTLQKRSLSW